MSRFFLLLVLLMPAVCRAELNVSDAWIKNLPPAVPVRAAYMTLHNPAASPQRIVALHSENFASVEIHHSVMQDGMMRMRQLPDLRIDAGETVQLAPGGLHLMLIQPDEPTQPGQTRRIELEFEDGSRQDVQLKVKK